MSVFIKLYENKMYLKNTKSGIEYTITPTHDFSQKGLLIGNVDNAIDCLKNGLKQIMPKIYFLKPKIYIQPMTNIDEITQAEAHTIIEVAYQAGARELFIIKNENEVDKK
ncbi:MAG: hypothetical protein Ta2B_16740 [Termitinemataceae bacterium]|nr:MAG: hypothetical protein Ta2B_16740 [Termitinemataceae bacterium]